MLAHSAIATISIASTNANVESTWYPTALRMKPLENPAMPPKKLIDMSATP